MDIVNASNILAGSILVGLSIIIVTAVAVAVNNIIHKYWKPITFIKFDSMPPRFASLEEIQKVEPSVK